MTRSNLLKYALKGLSCADIGQKAFISDDDIFIEFESGANVRLHDKEITYRAISFLESEIHYLKNNETTKA